MSLRDPMSQMANAQKLSIPQLQQALRDGTIDPQVGQLVLNSKINEDKKRKAAMAAQQPPQPTVAQQNMGYGIDAMPSNLPVAGMAGGGIIAFEEGGDVKHYVNDGLVEGDDPYYAAQEDSFLAPSTIRKAGKMGLDYTALLPWTAAKAGYNKLKANQPVWDPKQKKLVTREEYAAGPRNEMISQAAKAAADEYRGVAPPNLGTTSIGSMTDALRSGEVNPLLADATRGTADTSNADKVKKGIDDYFAGRESGSVSTRGGNPGIGGFDSKGYKIKQYDDKELKSIYQSELNPKTQQPWTYEDIAARDKAQQIAAGVDFDLFKNQQADLNKQKELSPERSRLNAAAPWFAFSEALSQQPKPGEARQSDIGLAARGLSAYGKTATDIDEKERDRQEKITDKGNALALAQNNFNLAQYTGNKADQKAADADLKAARLGLANLGIKKVDQQNEVAKTVYEANNKLQIAAMQEAGANARYGKDEQTIKSLAKIISDAHPDMPLDEVMKEAYRTKGAASIYGADLRSDTAVKAQYAKDKATFEKNLMNRGKTYMSYDDYLKMYNAGAGSASASADPYAGFSKLSAS